MARILSILNRYKFTLIYGVGFGLLGGFVLAVPFAVGGLLVDWLLKRSWDKERYFDNIMGCLIIALIGMFVYVPCIVFLYDSWKAFAWSLPILQFTEPMADKLSPYIPIINNYTKNLSDPFLILNIKQVLVVSWFINIVSLPLIIGDTVHFCVMASRKNFFISQGQKSLPANFRTYIDEAKTPDGSLNPKILKRRARGMLFEAGPILILVSFLGFYAGYWGIPIDDFKYLGSIGRALIITFGAFLGSGCFLMFTCHALILRKFYLSIQNGGTGNI